MSFGGTGGGQVRYALIVDDQATAKLNTFKNSLTQLGAGTTTLQRNLQGFNASLQQQTTAFKAGVAPINAQGNALTNLNSNINANVKQTKLSIGALKDHVLGMGVAASGVIGLVSSYTGLQKAMVMNEKASLMAEKARDRVTKIQNALNKMIAKGKEGTVDYNIKLKDLKVAQEQAGIMTERAGIIQEQTNEKITEFATNAAPSAIMAGAGVIDVFKGMGLNGDKLKGLTSKLGGAFSGLGATLTGTSGGFKTFLSNMTGATGGIKGMIGTLGPLALAVAGAVGVYEEFNAQLKIQQQVASGAIKPLEGARKELDQMSKLDWTSIEGAVISIAKLMGGSKALADILKPEVQRLKDVDAELKKVPPSMNAAATSTNAWVNMMIKALQSSDPKKIEEFNKAWKDGGGTVEEYRKIVEQADVILKKYNTTRTTANTLITKSTTLSQEELNVISRSKLAREQQNQWLVTLNGAYQETILKTTAAANAAKGEAAVIVGFGANVETLKEKFLALDAARKKVFNIDTGTEKFFQWLDNPNPTAITKLNKDLPALAAHLAEAEAGFKNLSKTMTSDLQKAADDAKAAIDKMRGGVQSGLDKIIEAFHKVHKKGKLDFEVNFDKAKKGFDKFLAEVGDKLDHGGAANAQKYILAFEKKGTAGMSKSSARMFQPLFDWIEKHKDEPADVFMSGFLQMLSTFDPKVSQQFKKLLDPTIGMSEDIGKKAGKAFSEELMAAINSTLKIADRFASQGAHPDRGSLKDIKPVEIPSIIIPPKPPVIPKQPTVKIPAQLELITNKGAGLASFWENAASKLGFGPRSKKDTVFTKGGKNEFGGPLSRSNGIEDLFGGTKPTKNPSIANPNFGGDVPFKEKFNTLPVSAGGGGGVKMPVLTIDTSKALQALGVVAVRIQDLAKIIPVIALQNASAIKAIDVIAIRLSTLTSIQPVITLINSAAIKAIDVIAQRIMSLTGLAPIISLVNKQAIKAVDVVAKRINDLTGIKPQISLQNKQAIKAVDVVAKRIDSLSNIKPQINLNNKNAIKAVDVVAKRIDSLSNLNPTVTVHVKTVGGAISAQKGLHAYLLEDTTIMAHKGEHVDIGHGGEGKGGGVTFNNMGGGGTGGGGDTIIENHIHIGDENLLRKFIARSGRNRFTMGA